MHIKKYLSQSENQGMYGPRQIIVTSEEITELEAASSSTHQWRAIEKVVVLSDAIYIYVSSKSAYIIPKRSFSGDVTFDEFAKQIQIYSCERQMELIAPISSAR